MTFDIENSTSVSRIHRAVYSYSNICLLYVMGCHFLKILSPHPILLFSYCSPFFSSCWLNLLHEHLTACSCVFGIKVFLPDGQVLELCIFLPYFFHIHVCMLFFFLF